MPHKVAYLFGAGASHGALKDADGSAKDLLMDGIADDIAIRMGQENEDASLDDVILALNDDVNIEQLITLYEASGNRRHSGFARKLKTHFRREIQDRIKPLGEGFVPRAYAALIDMHSVQGLDEQLTLILTTNYEDLIERAVQDVRGGVNYAIRANSTAGYLSIKPAGSVPIVLKLHGSFNWKNEYPIAVQRHIDNEDDIVWIPPGMVKRRQFYPFDVIWGKARELLECDALRIIGCSLTASDWELISLLFTTQRCGGKTGPQYEIELIDRPSRCEEIKRCGFLQGLKTILEIPEIRQSLVNDYLPDYIGEPAVPEDRIQKVGAYLNGQNPFVYWLRAKGGKLHNDGVPLETEKGYFKDFVLGGL